MTFYINHRITYSSSFMQTHHENDITPLIIRHINNDTTPEEEAWLQDQIVKDQSVKQLWEQLLEEFNRPEVKRLMAELPSRLPTSSMCAYAQRQKRIIYFKRLTIMAAAVITIGLMIWFLNVPRQNIQPRALALKDNTVQLKLGQSILDLSGDQQQTVGNVQVSARQKVVSVKTNIEKAETAVLTVPAGKFYQLHLPDGTVVFVNSASTVTFPTVFSGETREIAISGEAYVEVAKNVSHPFIVHLPKGEVLVMGTSFNINTYDNQVKVALITGAVKVDASSDAAVLRPGYAATYTIQGTALQVARYDDRILSWKDGLYYYHNTPLIDLCRALTRWYGIEVVLDKADLSTTRLTGTIHRDEPVDSFLENINLTSGLTFYKKEGTIHIK